MHRYGDEVAAIARPLRDAVPIGCRSRWPRRNALGRTAKIRTPMPMPPGRRAPLRGRIDETRALHPLHLLHIDTRELETYPCGV